MYRINFYVPASHLEVVKDALFDAGAGSIGDYQRCSWQVAGEGQFLPGDNSNPRIGTRGDLEKVAEYKVEMVCHRDCIEAAIAALKAAHPYEEPAWDVVAMVTDFGA